MASLQDQLLKAGLADEKKARQIKKEKRKQAKQTPKGQAQVNETRQLAKAVQAEKAARDRAINREQQALAEQKAIRAQIKQLIQSHRIDIQGGEVPYQFVDGKKIKKLFVTSIQQNQLSQGRVAIVKLGDGYELVPAVVADKIAQRDKSCILLKNDAAPVDENEDDPYKDFQIPDDLMW